MWWFSFWSLSFSVLQCKSVSSAVWARTLNVGDHTVINHTCNFVYKIDTYPAELGVIQRSIFWRLVLFVSVATCTSAVNDTLPPWVFSLSWTSDRNPFSNSSITVADRLLPITHVALTSSLPTQRTYYQLHSINTIYTISAIAVCIILLCMFIYKLRAIAIDNA